MGQLQLLLSYHAKNTSQIEFLTTLEMMEPSIAHLTRLLAEIFLLHLTLYHLVSTGTMVKMAYQL